MEPALTVIVVSHDCRDVLLDCLDSIRASAQDVDYAVHLVDNASSDGTVEAVRQRHPWVRLTESRENLGFAKANNLVLREARTPYVLLLNPDTLVPDHAFDTCIAHLEAHPRAGMAGCRLVTGDGSPDLACRRGFPTLWDGFCRASGLSALLPRVKLFTGYNLTWMDEGEAARVDALNGAFMLVTREALEKVGLLDEGYFMYMEDMDWCWRFAKAGFEVRYCPACTVVHLKGQSSRLKSARMIHAFFDSMELFCVKNTHPEPGLRRVAALAGIRAWKWLTLARNAARANKRVRP